MPDLPRDYYALLGVRRDATGDEIKRAYRKLAREFHPDVNPDPGAQEHFKQVTAAYEVLSDPEKRHIVDLGGDPLSTGPLRPAVLGKRPGLEALATFSRRSSAEERRARATTARVGRVPTRCCGWTSPWPRPHSASPRTSRRDGSALLHVRRQRVRAGHVARTCPICSGTGEVQSVQRSFLGQVMTSRPCSACGGTGQQISVPLPDVRL